jgi:glycerate kinase
MDALAAAMNGQIRRTVVTGPRGGTIEAEFAVTVLVASGDPGCIGIVELARASGLALLPAEERDPMRTTTFGTGELIQAAADAGAEQIIVCIGGSATCDGAAGLAQALGVRFFDADDRLITTPMTGSLLRSIARIEPSRHLPDLRIACDVTNPLLGEHGAAAVYGPQKGATPDQVVQLDAALAHLASLTTADSGFPGAGAAGGAGFGLVALCGAHLERGVELVLDVIGFEDRCAGADLVLTGEGRLDSQSLNGKATIGVARAAQLHNTPTIALIGSIGVGADSCLVGHDPPGPLLQMHALADRAGLDRAMRAPAALLREMTGAVIRDWLKGRVPGRG